MRTFSDYLSVIEHQNLLRMENRADPLCHDDHGAVFDILRQCFSKRRIRFQVKCRKLSSKIKIFGSFAIARAIARRCFCPPDTFVPPCAIAVSYLSSFASINSVAAQLRLPFRSPHPSHRLFRSAGGCDRSREQHTFLRHETDLIAQILHRNVSNIFSVERNLSARHIIETWDQVDQRRFTAAGASDDRRRLARLGNKVDVMQHILLGAG